MMRLLFFSFLITSLAACSVSKDPFRTEVKALVRGYTEDDTSYVYALPFEKGKSYFCVQGYFSMFTHRERAALDFRMRPGSIITAAREGRVIRTKADGRRGGMSPRFRKEGNHIVIEHPDGSRAGYWHLLTDGVLVKTGEYVKKGQPIALSGNTGMTSFPHLHFIVWGYDGKGKWKQIATRFQTSKGIGYLHAIKKYKNPL